jgi:DNA repair protein RecN (Recombination protein N)
MLTHLRIQDFAIIETVDLELGPGMTVLTGETGAGKSILLDALGLVLGDRADSSIVRHTADKADITANFEFNAQSGVHHWLEENDLQADGECILRRIVARDGRSKAYINGRLAPVQLLRQLGQRLVDIHGQHEHQSLLRPEEQRELLDQFANNSASLTQLAQCYQEWRAVGKEQARLLQAGAERDRRLELLRYQVGELEALDLGAEEVRELNEEHSLLANAGRLAQGGQSALAELYEDEPSVHATLGRSLRDIQSLLSLDAQLNPVAELLDGALIHLDEAVTTLRDYLSRLDMDPGRLDWVNQRLAAIQELARKHRVEPHQLLGHLTALREELSTLEYSGEHLASLAHRLEQLKISYQNLANELRESRQSAAERLSERITRVMKSVGMPGGSFAVRVIPLAEGRWSAHGQDEVGFWVSANPGQPLKPLKTVASGGELSRISLAIQMIASNNARIPTLIFDEVDSGIGGGVAEQVGRKLRALAGAHQILCVTHLPQVASQSHQHLQVSKLRQTDKQGGHRVTRTRIRELREEERVDELARMLGGVKLTPQSRAHAEEMLNQARPDTPVSGRF